MLSPPAAAPESPRRSNDQERLLGAVTLATMQRLGDRALLVDADNRACKGKMVRVGNIALTEWPADAARPREIYAYWVEGDTHWKAGPARCLYCLQWQHRGHPPDFHLQLVK